MTRIELRNFRGLAALAALMVLGAATLRQLEPPFPASGGGWDVPGQHPARTADASRSAASVSEPIPASTATRASVPMAEQIEVEVLDVHGHALGQAEVRWYRETETGFPEDEIGTTDESGAFFSPHLRTGRYRVWATAPGFQDSGVQELELPLPEGQRIRFQLQPDPVR